MQRRPLQVVLVLVVLVLAACSAPPHDATQPAAIAVLPDVPFALLDHEQRMQFMKERVVPELAPVFRAFDAQRFADFGCATCHGDEAGYAMPNPALPRLHADLTRHDARMVAWMTDVVRPTVARLLADDTVDCMRCHVRETR